MKTEREIKMLAIIAAKDYFERGLAVLAKEGYTPANSNYWDAQKAIIGLRADIELMRKNEFIATIYHGEQHA